MKTLILGDIHGRKCWKDIIEQENPDFIVFLGDYVSTHDDISSDTQIENLEEILCYKEANRDKVILLRGNHDMQHLGYEWARCSGYEAEVVKYMKANKERFLGLTQWVLVEDGVIYSHAGVSSVWMENSGIESVEKINEMEPSEIFGFSSAEPWDFYGTSPTQPCTWIRPHVLAECMYGDYVQVVGHTPNKSIGNKRVEYPFYDCKNDMWCCDCLPRQYLLIIDGEFTVKDCE